MRFAIMACELFKGGDALRWTDVERNSSRMPRELTKEVLLQLITIYQRTLSPDHGWFRSMYPKGYCKYSPTCSEYAKHAIQQKGIVVGLVKALWRILRCNPFSRGGLDEV